MRERKNQEMKEPGRTAFQLGRNWSMVAEDRVQTAITGVRLRSTAFLDPIPSFVKSSTTASNSDADIRQSAQLLLHIWQEFSWTYFQKFWREGSSEFRSLSATSAPELPFWFFTTPLVSVANFAPEFCPRPTDYLHTQRSLSTFYPARRHASPPSTRSFHIHGRLETDLLRIIREGNAWPVLHTASEMALSRSASTCVDGVDAGSGRRMHVKVDRGSQELHLRDGYGTGGTKNGRKHPFHSTGLTGSVAAVRC
ncbi:hypothetical protein DFH09DRAFT_1423861 [Mycena vulgaris]|nr:hypothetical protein DFH09DRAFT_1423861 [Mycena vulgaris]